MSQTVVGIFENFTQAQDAKAHLLAKGFSSENVDFNTSSTSGANTTASADEEGVGDRISNFFKHLFTDENEAASHISAGQKGIIITVHAQTSDEATEAAEILNSYGAVDVDDYSATTSGYGSSTDSTRNGDSTDTIKVIKEDLQVGKREVETGGVRLRSRIVERPVEESIRLREERVSIDRNTVDRLATEADFSNFKEGTIEVKEYAERPVVAKTARVVEEVSLGKEVSEREETVSDTVRHTEVETEKIPGSEKKYDDDNL